MVKLLEIRDLPEGNQLQLFLDSGSEQHEAPPVDFRDPLDDSDRLEIDWYFQEYLDHPFGPAKARAEAVEAGLRNLGRLLFEIVFAGNERAQQLMAVATADGLEGYQLAVVSPRAEFLSVPWELMNQPNVGYLATNLASIVHRVDAGPLPAYEGTLDTEQLNVLLVCPSPEPVGMETTSATVSLATETVKVLESLDVQVELDYLRPPTFEALTQELERRPAYYHVVQFDGIRTGNESGELVFESGDGSPEMVTAHRLADTLAAAQVPVALLIAGDRDARQSGATRIWTSLGVQACQDGSPFTVSLPYHLHGSPVGERFLHRFYQALARGEDVAAALAQARNGLMEEPQRSTLTGPQVFWDWITPRVFQSRQYAPARIEAEPVNPLAAPVIQNTADTEDEGQLPASGQYGLMGRQAELGRIERIFSSSPVAILSGSTGIGKTELALALARRFQKTGRKVRPGGVFYTTFQAAHPAGLERVVHEIGTAVAGLDFADMNAEQQRSWVVEYLKEQPSLLIWDGVESIAGFPPGAPGLLEEAEQAELDSFLSEVTTEGTSWALLVSRNRAEGWVTAPYARYDLSGLNPLERRDLAEAILTKAAVESGRVTEETVELLDTVEGHPLALQFALPLLKEVPPSVILGELRRGMTEFPDASVEAGRDNFLTVLMEYAWSKMSHRSRRHLPFLALFQRRVMMDILTHITQEPDYRTAIGEELGWGACRTLLRSALASGFLEPVSPSVYQIHPALPRFLGLKLGQQVTASVIGRLESEFVRVYADTADYFMESLYENQDSGATAVLAEEGNLNQALGLALEAGQWDNAQLLVQPLAQVYRMQKRIPELRRLRGQLLESVGQSSEEAEAKGAADLWLYLLGTDVSESVELGDLQRAEEFNQSLADYLTDQPGVETDPRAASVYHQFGAIALLRWQLDQAAGWFQRSMEIIESGEDRAAVADDYYALGRVRQYQRLYTEAKDWYGKALDIHQRLPDEEEMVKDYRALGLVTQLKFEHKEAESWYHRARDIVEENRDEETAVLVYHELGTVCHAQYLFDEAKNWYQQALTLSDRQGNGAQMAIELHHLGLLAQDRGIVFDEAEDWYLAALERKENLGDRRGVGEECRQLGVLFHEQKQYETAEHWYHQAREVFEELGDVQRTARTYGQLGMVAEEQDNLAGALEWVARTHKLVIDYDLPVLVQVKAHLARLRDKYGEESFNRWWQDFTGEEPPADLEVDASGIL